MWVQYDTVAGIIAASNSSRVSDEVLAGIGRAQVEVPDETDISAVRVDLTQTPPAIIPIAMND